MLNSKHPFVTAVTNSRQPSPLQLRKELNPKIFANFCQFRHDPYETPQCHCKLRVRSNYFTRDCMEKSSRPQIEFQMAVISLKLQVSLDCDVLPLDSREIIFYLTVIERFILRHAVRPIVIGSVIKSIGNKPTFHPLAKMIHKVSDAVRT